MDNLEKSSNFVGKLKTVNIMKIESFYPDRQSLTTIEEPYKGALGVLNILYMEAPPDGKRLSYKDVIDCYVMSCVRTIAEKLTEEENSFPSVFFRCKEMTFWHSTSDRMDFNDFRVNADYEHAAIFGAVYYVLTIQGKINQVYLDFIEKSFTSETRLIGYFQPFKEAAGKMKAEKVNPQKKDEVKKLTPAQAGLFCEAFLAIRECSYTNKKETIAPLASRLFGWAPTTMERNLTHTREDRNYVADLFKDCDPKFSSFVRDLDNKSTNQVQSRDSKKKKK